MHRTNLSKADVSCSDAPRPQRMGRLLGSDDLLDPPTELTLELLIEEPANTVLEASYSGAFPSLTDATSELISDLDLVEDEQETGALEIEPEPEEEAVADLSEEALCEVEPIKVAEATAETTTTTQKAWEVSLEDDASVDVSVSFTARRDALLPPVPSDATQELSADDVEEVKVEQVDALVTADLELLVEQQQAQAPAPASETVLYYCRPGETLPPGAEYAEELPRFAISSKRKAFARLHRCAGNAQHPASPLPSFRIDGASQTSSKLPPPRLPKFIID
ncbi:MAG: hypothetical protein HY898_24390 [Deltaproteobacteria bacterium]|nr:hypothetical protein [Deltaproteobacteria bacterium]